jgi:hypothetical protein
MSNPMDERLYLQREGDETWREAAAKCAKRHGLEREVLANFDRAKAAQPERDEAEIAFHACYEWDVLYLTADIKGVSK